MAGKAKEKQSARAGTYILADGLVNGYPHWLKTGDGSDAISFDKVASAWLVDPHWLKTGDGSDAIWFDKVASAWLVGPKKYLGTGIGHIAGPNGKDSYPNEIKQGWKFTPGWQDATPSEIMFKAIGKFFKPSLHKINSTSSLHKTAFNLFKTCLLDKKISNYLFLYKINLVWNSLFILKLDSNM